MPYVAGIQINVFRDQLDISVEVMQALGFYQQGRKPKAGIEGPKAFFSSGVGSNIALAEVVYDSLENAPKPHISIAIENAQLSIVSIGILCRPKGIQVLSGKAESLFPGPEIWLLTIHQIFHASFSLVQLLEDVPIEGGTIPFKLEDQ